MCVLSVLTAAGVTGVAIIVGVTENAQFKELQLQRQMMMQPYYTQLNPDLRAAQRIGKEREDFDPVHIWIRVELIGGCTLRYGSFPSSTTPGRHLPTRADPVACFGNTVGTNLGVWQSDV